MHYEYRRNTAGSNDRATRHFQTPGDGYTLDQRDNDFSFAGGSSMDCINDSHSIEFPCPVHIAVERVTHPPTTLIVESPYRKVPPDVSRSLTCRQKRVPYFCSYKVWMGTVIDPAQGEDEAVPRTISMVWGDVCSTEVGDPSI